MNKPDDAVHKIITQTIPDACDDAPFWKEAADRVIATLDQAGYEIRKQVDEAVDVIDLIDAYDDAYTFHVGEYDTHENYDRSEAHIAGLRAVAELARKRETE